MSGQSPAGDHVWHVLQRSDVLDEEMASALAEFAPVVLWEPQRTVWPIRLGAHNGHTDVSESKLRIERFPLMRGFARLPAVALDKMEARLATHIAKVTATASASTLVCTTSLFAGVAERWAGPVVYWLTDLMARYDSLHGPLVERLDRQLCARATLVCPNSERLADYLREEAGCAADKVVVIPNAARLQSILPAPPSGPAPLLPEYARLERPVAGVIGNLAENMDWVFLRRLLELTPWLSWVFVGSTEMAIKDPEQRRAREQVIADEKTCFVGPRPYQELIRHARAVDVAVLPYMRREPTYSGSSTRFYQHLAACQPIVATSGVADLLSKEPLLKLVTSAEDAAMVLEGLRARGFDDGLREMRWEASRKNTWRDRALRMREALELRVSVRG